MRLMVYSHDAFGLGNIRRMLAICEHLLTEIANLSILLLSGSPMLQGFRLPKRLDYIKLPCLNRGDSGDMAVKYLDLDLEQTVNLRSDLILSTAIHYQPDVVLVDKKPYGIQGELTRTLDYLKEALPQTKLVLLLRDILDAPDRTIAEWEKVDFNRAIETFYDRIMVVGMSQVFDLRKAYKMPAAIAKKVDFCGYLRRPAGLKTMAQVQRELGLSAEDSLVLVTYLLKTYPKISETFILNEILELERQGINLHLFSLKLPEDARNHPKVERVKAPVTYIPLMRQRKQFNWSGTLALVQAHWALFWQNRQRYMTALKSAWNHPENKPIDIFLQAGYLARQLQILGITHLQTHFANIPTAVTEIVQQLTGISYSIFAHAKDIYLTSEEVLDRRIANAEFVLTCTKFNRNFLQQISTSDTPIHLSYHGIDFSLFDGRRTQSETDVPLMMSVGRFCQKKGFPYLIQACHILKTKGIKFRCEIVGYGPMKKDLEALVELFNLQDVIYFPGKMAQDKLVQIYRKASLFVLPCLVTDDGDRDGIPNVLLEAMAMQLPVVSTDISGISEVVRSGQNGFLVPQKDAASLAVQLETLLTQPELRKQFGEAGRQQVMQQFSLDRNVGEIRDLLIEVTQPSAPPESQFVRQVPALVSL